MSVWSRSGRLILAACKAEAASLSIGRRQGHRRLRRRSWCGAGQGRAARRPARRPPTRTGPSVDVVSACEGQVAVNTDEVGEGVIEDGDPLVLGPRRPPRGEDGYAGQQAPQPGRGGVARRRNSHGRWPACWRGAEDQRRHSHCPDAHLGGAFEHSSADSAWAHRAALGRRHGHSRRGLRPVTRVPMGGIVAGRVAAGSVDREFCRCWRAIAPCHVPTVYWASCSRAVVQPLAGAPRMLVGIGAGEAALPGAMAHAAPPASTWWYRRRCRRDGGRLAGGFRSRISAQPPRSSSPTRSGGPCDVAVGLPAACCATGSSARASGGELRWRRRRTRASAGRTTGRHRPRRRVDRPAGRRGPSCSSASTPASPMPWTWPPAAAPAAENAAAARTVYAPSRCRTAPAASPRHGGGHARPTTSSTRPGPPWLSRSWTPRRSRALASGDPAAAARKIACQALICARRSSILLGDQLRGPSDEAADPMARTSGGAPPPQRDQEAGAWGAQRDMARAGPAVRRWKWIPAPNPFGAGCRLWVVEQSSPAKGMLGRSSRRGGACTVSQARVQACDVAEFLGGPLERCRGES